jgi:ATP/maltotriose-dependent transcriptional regulator MalT
MSDSDPRAANVESCESLRDLQRARDCYRRGAWSDAYEAFASADRDSSLGTGDLELLATSAYLIGRDTEYLKALERAHLLYLKAGELLRSARCIFWLGFRLALRGDIGQATGWFGRAERMLKRETTPNVEEGYLLVPVVEQRLDAGEFDAAYAAAARAAELGERFEDVDLTTMAHHQQGRARLGQGRFEEGLALLDEVMVAVIAGQLSPIVTGLMYCSVIDSCTQIYALGRASEWTWALARWCDAQPDMVAFTGLCLVHRAEILELSGAWAPAMDQAQRARENRAVSERTVGAALCRLGTLHRLKGEFAAAEKAYRAASQAGCDPLPGLALLRLAQGRPAAALAAIRRALKGVTNAWDRTKILPDYVEILLANGDVREARKVSGELDELANALKPGILGAIAAQTRGAVELAQGKAEAALVSLRCAAHAWQEVKAPYPVARIRVLMGLAYRDLGDAEGSALELEAARAVFERLGALPDVERVDAFKRSPSGEGHRLTVRELEVLRLIAAGHTNKAIAKRLFVSERTVDRHVSNIFGKLKVFSRAAATAYAYEHAMI